MVGLGAVFVGVAGAVLEAVGCGFVDVFVGDPVGLELEVVVALAVVSVGPGSVVAVPSIGLVDSPGSADVESDGAGVSVEVESDVELEVVVDDEKTFGAEQPATTTEPTTATVAQVSRIVLVEVLMERR